MRTAYYWQTAIFPRRWGSVVGLALAGLGTSLAMAFPNGTTTRVSRHSDGIQGNASSTFSALSADGQVVAFTSYASNLVPGDTNNMPDIFVHDRQTGITTRVSRHSDGTQGNNSSTTPALSADGQVVAFTSYASNLVPGNTNNEPDIFVHDRQTGITTRVSRHSDGTQGNAHSGAPALSADGQVVAFASYASNLVPGDTNNMPDVFVHDRQTGTTTRVSRNSAGTQGNAYSDAPALSADGQVVAFFSEASNLVPGDTNNAPDVFVHDRQTGITTRVSRHSAGTQGNQVSFKPALSADGQVVAFFSFASNLVPGDTNNAPDIFVHDRQTGTTTLVSRNSAGTQGTAPIDTPALSADGQVVAFASYAFNLVPGDTNNMYDVFVHDRQTETTTLVSRNSAGTQGSRHSALPALSADGQVVAFFSVASNLVPGDTNNEPDVFVYDPWVCYGFAVTILGTPGDDVLVGTAGDDVIAGLDGNDSLAGGEGNDVLCGGPGQDRLRGGAGNDRLFGDAGDDVLLGGNGHDRLSGGPDDDTLDGGAGRDRLRGNRGDDTLDGGFGSDVCDGGHQIIADTAAACEAIVNVP